MSSGKFAVTPRRVVRWVVNALLVLVFAFPFVWMVSSSLKTLGETMTFPPSLLPADPQWENYSTVMTTIPFWRFLLNSVIVTFSVLVLQALTVVPAAYAFSQYDFKGKGVLFGLTLITMMVPAQLVFLPLFVMFARWGIINTYASLILPFATSAFNIFMLRQTFNQMPRELVEAARLDNASEFQIIWKLFLPMAKATLVTCALLTFIATWNDYFWPLVLTTNDTVRTLPVGVANMRASENGINYQILMAANVLLTLPILVVYIFANKHIIKAFSYIGDK
ncbi:MAG: carbohydrate ABC transporter permease [Tractidigestivibacter sp.]|jgi:sn-glycerol 3-phosphate transport system permease protein|uniref:carbohydrate ABC transporter permease n=1 Tax=Tractidigestivibacter sp. TaxID=2847320 RepID=UPI003D8D6BA1